jgi:hypothetical protein
MSMYELWQAHIVPILAKRVITCRNLSFCDVQGHSPWSGHLGEYAERKCGDATE